ncbi:MAG: outer membrane protein assembly factor BamD [Acidobacteriaceae bacterium]|nr:outer membrane protein assembly factor BamD [Acidobacteriaceae bacterium]
MVFRQLILKQAVLLALALGLLSSCIHKKYDTPITKNTQQPDKVLFDQAIKDIEHGRYEVARISLQTLMNTYESSEYMAKAKLAIADSWYREGGSNGMAQAEAEYKDFILFYPQMEESAEAQSRVCDIHYKQMDKSDRDWSQTLRAETECRALLQQFPNSKFVPQTTQRLRYIQESLAEHEFVVGNFYWKREMNPAAANRLTALVTQYPLYSKAGESLYEAGDAYSKMGPRFRKQAGEQFAKVVREYPLSNRAKDAKSRLEDLELPVPQADPVALKHAQYEQESYHRPGVMSRSMGLLRGGPDVTHAAHSGQPTMTDPKPTIPVSVPIPAATEALSNTNSGGTGTTDVSATRVGSNSALDTNPDARRSSGETAQGNNNPTVQQALPTNRDADLKKLREKQAKKQQKLDKKKQKGQDQTQAKGGAQTPAGTATPASVPPSSQP